MNKNDIEDLQSRISFQEEYIEKLSVRMSEQQAQIDRMQLQLVHLSKKLKDIELNASSIDLGDQLPPHY